MRLGQLARKLDVKPSEIVGYLATKSIAIEENANTKLEAAHVAQAIDHFAPHLKTPEVHITDDVPVTDNPIVINNATVGVVDEQVTPSSLAPVSAFDDEAEQSEIIKAPKIELSGLKVLGKIELPEPKKKLPDGPLEEAVSSVPLREPSEVKKEKRNSLEHRKPRSQKNPIALKREQEEKEARGKKEEELRIKKEQKTQNYLKKVKVPQPTKAARQLRENTVEMSAQELAEHPKTWWGKFKKWLTT